MEEERNECFTPTAKLSSLVFEGQAVEEVRIMVTTIPVKLIATVDKIYYANLNTKPLTEKELFELKSNANKAVPIFNTILQGSQSTDDSFRLLRVLLPTPG